jgi:DNA-binding HxlR family transcriptional regulator
VEVTLYVVGGKWKPRILWELRHGPRHFNALHAALAGISHKVLAAQLRGLERSGVLSRTQRFDAKDRVRRVDYALSQFGRTLRPVLDSMAGWAKVHHRRVGVVLDWSPRPPERSKRTMLALRPTLNKSHGVRP